jgi:Ni,Fe-hydrogenase I large subunit
VSKIIVDPLTRIEGHLKIEAAIENGVVTDAKSCGCYSVGWKFSCAVATF